MIPTPKEPFLRKQICQDYVKFINHSHTKNEEIDFELIKVLKSIGIAKAADTAILKSEKKRKRAALFSAYLIALRYLHGRCYRNHCEPDKCYCNDPRMWPGDGLPLVSKDMTDSTYIYF